MEGKEVRCTCKVFFSKILLITGIIGGVIMIILGIVTITADTGNLFAPTFFRWYTRDIRRITFTDSQGFSSHEIWIRPQDYLLFEWTTQNNVAVFEADEKYAVLPNGLKSSFTGNGEEYFHMDNLTLTKHWFCKSINNKECEYDPSGKFHILVHVYKDNLFYTNGYLGNQNMRWTFFLLAVLTVTFGVIMILGELHVPLITTKFTFFYYSFVKGVIYFAIGFLLMGMSNLFGLFCAIYMWLLGILNCIYGWRSLTTFQWNKVGATGTTTIVTRREYI